MGLSYLWASLEICNGSATENVRLEALLVVHHGAGSEEGLWFAALGFFGLELHSSTTSSLIIICLSLFSSFLCYVCFFFFVYSLFNISVWVIYNVWVYVFLSDKWKRINTWASGPWRRLNNKHLSFGRH